MEKSVFETLFEVNVNDQSFLESITYIGSNAFDSTKLTSINTPTRVNSIEYAAFAGTSMVKRKITRKSISCDKRNFNRWNEDK